MKECSEIDICKATKDQADFNQIGLSMWAWKTPRNQKCIHEHFRHGEKYDMRIAGELEAVMR